MCVCLCVCMYVCMCMYVCVYVCMYVCIQISYTYRRPTVAHIPCPEHFPVLWVLLCACFYVHMYA